MAWQSTTINPTVTTPADDISKIKNDLGVLRGVLGGTPDPDVPFSATTGATVNTIAVLRTVVAASRPSVFVLGYYAAGDGGGGWYAYDAGDTTSADNGGTVIVGAGGARWKLITQGSIDVAHFGATASSDSRAAIQAALNSGLPEIRVGAMHPVSGYLLVPAGVRFVGSGHLSGVVATANIGNYAAFGSSHQGQMLLLVGDDASVESMWINGGNFNAGGVAVAGTSRNRVIGTLSTNHGNSQAQLWSGSKQMTSALNTIQYAKHGIQMWQTDGGTVNANTVRVVDEGGIWTADTANMQITANVVKYCGDVGLDLEGGVNNSITGNSVIGCKNGEIAWFNNGTGGSRVPFNNTISGNVAFRTPTYLAGTAEVSTATDTTFGALTLYSITTGQQNITFKGNTIWANGRPALYSNDLGANFCGIEISGNTFSSDTLLHNINRAYGIRVIGNTFRGLGSAVAAATNQFKNCSGGLWDSNAYEYDTAKNTNAALYYYTDAAISSPPTISRNKFRNCGAFAFRHDPYVSGVPAIVMENEFSEDYVSNGGVEATANGRPTFRNQRLNISISDGTASPSKDLSTLTSLQDSATTLKCMLQIWSGATRGATYELIYAYSGNIFSRDGSGVNSGIVPNGVRYATFSGSTASITGPVAGTVGYLTANADTMK